MHHDTTETPRFGIQTCPRCRRAQRNFNPATGDWNRWYPSGKCEETQMISEHIDNNGEFQSDKFGEWCLANFVPLKVSDPMAQPVLFAYAKERAVKDTQFSNDLVWALAIKGYGPAMDAVKMVDGEPTQMPFVVMRPDPHATTGGVVWLPGPHPMPFPESSK